MSLFTIKHVYTVNMSAPNCWIHRWPWSL